MEFVIAELKSHCSIKFAYFSSLVFLQTLKRITHAFLFSLSPLPGTLCLPDFCILGCCFLFKSLCPQRPSMTIQLKVASLVWLAQHLNSYLLFDCLPVSVLQNMSMRTENLLASCTSVDPAPRLGSIVTCYLPANI
jgi:hypothetical protein